jgi:tyrosine-protein kinase Etk/Wzc
MADERIDGEINDPAAEGSVLSALVVISKRKKVLFASTALSASLSLVVALLLPNWYAASTKLMPPQQTQSNAVAILGQLGALAGGAGQALGLKNPSDVYVAMLKSRTVTDAIINRFDLKRLYGEDYLVDARKEFAKHISITTGRDGVITIDVEDREPKRAAEIANAYIEELRRVTLNLAVSEASQRRLFFETQLKKVKQDLVLAEAEMMKFSLESGLVNPQGQVSLSVSAAAALRAQIAAREIQASAMRSFATENNPDLVRAQKELAGLRAELAKMEKNANIGKGDVLVPFGKAPEMSLEYVRRLRDLKYQETMFEVLSRQYEIARIDEAKDATLIQVLDVAAEPEKKSRPKIWMVVLVSTLSALVAAIFGILLFEKANQQLGNPQTLAKLRELRSHLFGR